ncbi:glycosyltransferase family 2 protein [Flavobacterium franklandianum]|uniref:Glycosyltransferase n=1 Tax=Flavobacterium franklandianum TaxID=2594430 RepID=A0A553C5N4_9FLAO|nr:glycosyltransferase family 2 protein [Flavobacterium franklandianum]TRX15850.1 glycosyltransferase [Flavobacterium franklandianum]
MNENILITIVTPSYNQGQFIEETILSVLNQTYKNIQYIIIDGGSTDQTMNVVNKYKDQIDIIIHEKDKGQTDAINKGFKLAKGELVGWINSDDILYADCVEKVVKKYIEEPDGAIYYNRFNTMIDAKGEVIKNYEKNIPNRKYLLSINYDVIQQGSFYKKELVKKVGYLNDKNHYCMDLDLWLRLLNYGSIYNVSKCSSAGFRMWEETKTNTGKEKFLKNIREVLISNGAKYYSKSVRKTYWYELKVYVKYFLKL